MMRIFTDLFRACIITLLYITVASCAGACASTNNIKPVRHKFPVQSFVQIRQETLWQGCEVDEKTKKEKCQKGVMRAVSSGAWVAHSEVDSSVSYVLTAGHSCRNTFKPPAVIAGVKVTHLGQKFTIVDFNGFKHSGKVISIEKKFDTCLLSVSNVYIKPPVLRVSPEPPKRGELLYNMAAPHGIVAPRMVLTFDGYFSGYSPEGYAIYTIPTKPGSSGSPIINVHNELVGIIFAGYRSMENIGVASPLIAVKVFLKKSIAKAEMDIWSLANKGNDKTSTTMTEKYQRLEKRLDDFFNIPRIRRFGDK
jgi:S1-C subfamily serine protease